jgi:hypothetical protein
MPRKFKKRGGVLVDQRTLIHAPTKYVDDVTATTALQTDSLQK